MSTARDAILAAAIALLQAAPAMADQVLEDDDADDLDEGITSAIKVALLPSTVDTPDTASQVGCDARTPLRIDAYCRNDTPGAGGLRPTSALLQQAHARIRLIEQDGSLAIHTIDLSGLGVDHSRVNARRRAQSAIYDITHRISIDTLKPVVD